MKIRLLLSVALGMLLASGARAAWDWQSVTSEAGRLSCLMPGKPAVKQTAVPTPAGPVNVVEITLASKTIPGVFRVLYGDLPGRVNPSISARARLGAGRDGEVEKYGSPARDDQEISLQGYPGRSFTIDMPKGWITQYRMYLVGQRLYQIIAYIPKTAENSPETKKYLGSLQLLPQK